MPEDTTLLIKQQAKNVKYNAQETEKGMYKIPNKPLKWRWAAEALPTAVNSDRVEGRTMKGKE